jgi:hypothetical protein
MAKLTTAERKKLPAKVFGIPEKAPKSGSYPMPDKQHAIEAESRASGKPVEKRVRAKAQSLYPSLKNPAKLHSLASMAA